MSEPKACFPFSDEELKKAAGLVAESMLGALPERIDPPHAFSEAFQAKMEKLMHKQKVRRARLRFLRGAAAVLAVILVMAGVWLATDTDAWADLQRWFRHISGTDVIYGYAGPAPSEPLPEYEMGWLPEGYVFSFELEEIPGLARRIAYEKEGQDILYFAYGYMSEEYESTVTGDGPADFERVTVAGMEGDLHYTEGMGSNVLTWFDEEAGIHFALQTNLSKLAMLKIAENVRPLP